MTSSISVYLPDYGYTYRFSGVLSVKHEMSLNIQKDGESLYHTDYVNGARNAPNKVILEVLESDIGHAAGWATRMMQAMESIKRNRVLCTVVTSAFALSGMLLSEFTATEDETSQSGWQGTLTFTRSETSSGTTKMYDNSSLPTHTGSTGMVQTVCGTELIQMLQRAGVV